MAVIAKVEFLKPSTEPCYEHAFARLIRNDAEADSTSNGMRIRVLEVGPHKDDNRFSMYRIIPINSGLPVDLEALASAQVCLLDWFINDLAT